MIEDRANDEDKGELIILPLYDGLYRDEPSHPYHELEKKVESLADYPRMISLVDQLGKVEIDSAVIRAAIGRTN